MFQSFEEFGHLHSSLGQFLWKVLVLVVYFWGQIHAWICDLLQLSRFGLKGHENPETGGREDAERSQDGSSCAWVCPSPTTPCHVERAFSQPCPCSWLGLSTAPPLLKKQVILNQEPPLKHPGGAELLMFSKSLVQFPLAQKLSMGMLNYKP